MENEKKKPIFKICAFVLLFVALAWLFLVVWTFRTWSYLDVDQLIFQLKASSEGTGDSIVTSGVIWTIAPTVVIGLLLLFIALNLKKKIIYKIFFFASIALILATSIYGWCRLDLTNYIKNANNKSDFIETEYVDPASVDITFPEEKRNLIYIYLESVEMTYADKEIGGAFEENVIPELSQLSLENENFSGDKSTLNGAYPLTGGTWTMAALFSQTSGLPLKIEIDGNSMNTQNTFFPSITTLGDILEGEGYNNVFMIGSDAAFGGRELYFSEHGDYDILDYNYAVENELIPDDYYVFWGYEDEKLFSNAKDELLKLSESDEPFNFSMLTVDTHFEDGYVCDLCEDTFGDNQYANVMACSSKQVSEFIEWIK